MADGCFLDSNILLRLVWLKDPDSAAVEKAFAALLLSGRPLYSSLQNASEYWNVCTRPVSSNGLALTPDQASAGLVLLQRHVALLPETGDVYERWLNLVHEHKVIGRQVHDAKLAAVMMAHGVPEILTLNVRDFIRFPKIRVTSPLEFA